MLYIVYAWWRRVEKASGENWEISGMTILG